MHVRFLKKKSAYGIRVLLNARHYFQKHTLLTLYYAFKYSHLNYCISSCGLTYRCHIAPLQHIQNNAVCIIAPAPYNAHVNPIFPYLNLLTINKIIWYNHSIVIYRVLKNPQLHYIIGRNSLANRNNTRFFLKNNLLFRKSRSNYGQLTVGFASVKMWNNLPAHVKYPHLHYRHTNVH